MKHFVLAGNELSPLQRNTITKYLSDTGYGYWHWFQDFWLVTSANNYVTSVNLRESLKLVVPGTHFMVFAVEPSPDWAGVGNETWAEWIHQNWSRQ
jgi:hypothetical protein